MKLDIDDIGKFIALGSTFTTHQKEKNRSCRWPDVWMVPPEGVISEKEPIQIPERVDTIKPASELTAVIGKEIWQATNNEAWEAIKGFTISNDVTAGGEWPGLSDPNLGIVTGIGYKLFPTFSPILTKYQPKKPKEVYNDLEITVDVDGERSVEGSTSQLAFSIPEMISFASNIIKLKEDDVVALGDPGRPSKMLDTAHSVTSSIEGIGSLQNPVEQL